MRFTPLSLASVALIGFWLIELFLRQGSTARSWRPTAMDRGSTVAIVAAYLLVGIALSLQLRGPHLPWTVQWAGAWLSIVGVVLRVVAFRTLGTSYARTLRVNANQELITHGIYRWIRHPGYASALLIWSGAAAASGAALAFLTVSLLLVGIYVYRMRVEEVMLSQFFGVTYQQYQARSWHLVPYVY
jgi:protein-S-isoprenylcysteine O-methyltransferase Ste14